MIRFKIWKNKIIICKRGEVGVFGFGNAKPMAIDQQALCTAVRVDLPSSVARRKVQRTN